MLVTQHLAKSAALYFQLLLGRLGHALIGELAEFHFELSQLTLFTFGQTEITV